MFIKGLLDTRPSAKNFTRVVHNLSCKCSYIRRSKRSWHLSPVPQMFCFNWFRVKTGPWHFFHALQVTLIYSQGGEYHFIRLASFNSSINRRKWLLCLCPFCRWEGRCSERLNSLPKEVVVSEFEPRQLNSWHLGLSHETTQNEHREDRKSLELQIQEKGAAGAPVLTTSSS